MLAASWQTRSPSALSGPGGPVILVIEANPSIRDMLLWSLRLYGYRPIALLPTQSMTPLWRMTVACDPPSLILLDVAYAQETEAILSYVSQQWQSTFACALPPMVLLTTAAHRQRSLEQQTGYPVLPKPFHLLDLRQVIERHLPTQRAPEMVQNLRAL